MNTRDVEAIQQALHDKGFDPGPVDGIWGRKTIAAVKEFQRAEGLEVDGIYGPMTSSRLFPPETAKPYEAPWMAEAARLIATKEFLGERDNPEILNWADRIDIPYDGDDVPWCGLFVGHCIATTLPDEPLPKGLLGARSWLKLGKKSTPRIGAVMVFWRGSKESWEGHVGFYAGQNGSNFLILGGNQSDSVCYTWIHRDRLLEARWPVTAISLEDSAQVVDVPPGSAATYTASLS